MGKDEERHLLEYERYEIELEKLIPKETRKQYKYWFENRLKSVKKRLQDVSVEIKNG